ncbi:MAG: ComF family protein [Candidatus Paceibacteria bacterium]|jgi:ComF family protein
MHKLLTEFFNFLFPPSGKEELLFKTKLTTLLTLYQPGIFQNIKYLCPYSKPIVQAAIIENKFHHNQLAAQHLGRILKQWVSTQTQKTLYVPIPLGKQRLRHRGHNQVETILKTIIDKAHINNKLLQRRIETLPQSKLSKTARQKNLQNAFQFIPNDTDFLNYSQIVLIDDVLTTGATLHAARTAITPHLPPNLSLVCLAIAH